MSAPPEPPASAPCACTNITLMQLFHELKQKFPGVPDHIVSNTIELYCHDKQACEAHLHKEVKASLTHAYHGSSSAAARQLHELKINPPTKCRNQPAHKSEVQKVLTPELLLNPDTLKSVLNTDANQNVIENRHVINKYVVNTINSPVAIVNLDDCYENCETVNDNIKITSQNQESNNYINSHNSADYKITKSHKVKSNLNEKLRNVKEKQTINKEESKNTTEERPKRPNTLEFIKPNPDIAFKLKESIVDDKPTVNPQNPLTKDTPTNKLDRAYPLNLSVNVNCHMGYREPWLEQYDSPRAITSVNLTVCTPTSNMESPVRESQDDEGAFEGHVTVTVSPSTARAPRRRAPVPSAAPKSDPHRSARPAPNPSNEAVTEESPVIEMQKERLNRLKKALALEKDKMSQLTRETQILEAPLPSETTLQRLREYVERLRDQCDMLAKRLELGSNESEDSPNFYSNIYTGQRPSSSWQCHMCTFRNHPLLDKCEECDMPRILVGTSPSRTHDSGFGSFRDKSRNRCLGLNYSDVDVVNTSACVSNMVKDSRPLSRLNC